MEVPPEPGRPAGFIWIAKEVAGGRGVVPTLESDGAVDGDGLRRRECIMAARIQPWPIVQQGDREHPVRTLQHLLRARGRTVVVDGVFGPKTDAAVRAFQKDQKLTQDGDVGPLTWPVLVVQVKKGNTGDAVRGVQEEFQFRNLSGDPRKGVQIDGIFGPETDDAVRAFQGAVGLEADGIVGPLTWRALVSGELAG